MFPADFFNNMKENSGFKSERNQSNTANSLENFQNKSDLQKSYNISKKTSNDKIISDLQTDLDEDKEFLDLFNTETKSKIKFNNLN